MILTTDQWNAINELGAAFFAALNVVALYRAKKVSGVHWAAWGFYSYWGLANLIVYPANHMVWSFWGGIPVVVFNLAWLWLVFWYRNGVDITFTNGSKIYFKPSNETLKGSMP